MAAISVLARIAGDEFRWQYILPSFLSKAFQRLCRSIVCLDITWRDDPVDFAHLAGANTYCGHHLLIHSPSFGFLPQVVANHSLMAEGAGRPPPCIVPSLESNSMSESSATSKRHRFERLCRGRPAGQPADLLSCRGLSEVPEEPLRRRRGLDT